VRAKLELDIEAIFKFINDNPPMALISGGVLFILAGALFLPFYPQSSEVLFSAAPWLIVEGIALQILWLFRGAINDLLR
jgi:hypothetical protein